jgi:signal peptidase II
VIFGTFYLQKIIRQGYHKGFIICATLIYAGAIGNLLDSMFYGLIFDNSDPYLQNTARLFPPHGYAGFLHGKVVDMLYFPIITDAHFPKWVPFGRWGFRILQTCFQYCSTSISLGVILILVFKIILPEKEAGLSSHGKNELYGK